MKVIKMASNESGAYSAIQEASFARVPEGVAEWPAELSTETFYAYKGFVTLSFEEVKVEKVFSHYRVAKCQPNAEAYEAWETEHPEPEPVEPEPTGEDLRDSMLGVSE